ncbi:MAG: TetR/AcrR family transcriptional regulator [Arachnia sp.]
MSVLDAAAAATDSLRDRKKRETRQRIHRIALCLVLERGLDQVTVQDIADGADISPRTLFNYYACKEDAVVGFDAASVETLAQRLLERPAEESLATALRAAVSGHLGEVSTDAELLQLRRRLAEQHPELASRLAGAGQRRERALATAAYQRSGTTPATDLQPSVLARVALAAARAAFEQHRVAEAGSLIDRLQEAFDIAGL